MNIAKIIIPNFQQFKGFELDLTYPEGHAKAGQPLEKVCFIGRNGTGKSTLLRLVNNNVRFYRQKGQSFSFLMKLQTKRGYIYKLNAPYLLWEYVEKDHNVWSELIRSGTPSDDGFVHYIVQDSDVPRELFLESNLSNLLIYSPPESGISEFLTTQDAPTTSLNEALEYFKAFPTVHEVSIQNIRDFWRLLIFLIKKRESDFLIHQERSENQEKTLKQVREEFNREHPEILKGIADLWNQILENAGLEFDYQGAKVPVQLTDSLQAYIKLKSSGKTIPYNALSTGIRNFIFRLGHIYALYFNRKIESGFLLIDEPENSLFPDFLYDLVNIYQGIIHNTQFFVATHSPIIAAQFEPEERFILDFNDEGFVTARRGVTAVGDDPNDMLVQDFGVRSLLGPKGQEKWERFVELKMLLKHTNDPVQKEQLAEEYAQIGRDYNFPAR